MPYKFETTGRVTGETLLSIHQTLVVPTIVRYMYDSMNISHTASLFLSPESSVEILSGYDVVDSSFNGQRSYGSYPEKKVRGFLPAYTSSIISPAAAARDDSISEVFFISLDRKGSYKRRQVIGTYSFSLPSAWAKRRRK